MCTAILLIAHGSRQPNANADLTQIADSLRQRPDFAIVEESFLELAEPTIEVGAGRCVAQGAARVVMAPYFLSAGVHVLRDLTAMRDKLNRRYPAVQFFLAAPLGPNPVLSELVAQRALQALANMAFP